MDHLRWIGGGSGAGKSTVAGELAARFGFGLYSSDATIRIHADQLGKTSAPLMDRFIRKSMDERWVLSRTADMYREFPWFHGEGFDLLLADLRALPTDRITIVEGFRLLPDRVAPHLSDPRHGCWLLPTPDLRRAAFDRRAPSEAFWLRTSRPDRALANLLERDAMFTEVLAGDAARLGLPTLIVDGARTLTETVDLLADRLDLAR